MALPRLWALLVLALALALGPRWPLEGCDVAELELWLLRMLPKSGWPLKLGVDPGGSNTWEDRNSERVALWMDSRCPLLRRNIDGGGWSFMAR